MKWPGSRQDRCSEQPIVTVGGAVGRAGVPHKEEISQGATEILPQHYRWRRPAPVRHSIEELPPEVPESRIQPGRVFERTVGLDGVPYGYRAMDAREAIKVMVKP